MLNKVVVVFVLKNNEFSRLVSTVPHSRGKVQIKGEFLSWLGGISLYPISMFRVSKRGAKKKKKERKRKRKKKKKKEKKRKNIYFIIRLNIKENFNVLFLYLSLILIRICNLLGSSAS